MATKNWLDVLRAALVEDGGKLEDFQIVSVPYVAGEVSVTSYVALTRNVYDITVDYDLSFEAMIAECGCDRVDKLITADNFKISGDGKVKADIILLYFGRDVSIGEVVEKMQKLGLEPAKLEHALAFGKKFAVEKSIVFLSSSLEVNGVRLVPCLSTEHTLGRELYLPLFEDVGEGGNWFATIRRPVEDADPHR